MATDDARAQEPPLSPADAAVVHRSLRALRCGGPTRVVRKLAGGGSGSQVFLLEHEGEHVVLKATEDPGWQEQAARELAVYRELAPSLHGFLPAVLAHQRDQHAVRLLLTAHEPSPPAVELTHEVWVDVAGRLGQLQRAPIPRPPWLRDRSWPSPNEAAAAVRAWSGHGFAPLAARAAQQLASARDVYHRLEPVLTHGDCHVGNLLQGPTGQILWADWQDVCLSSGLDDLVFLWQRAEFEGAHPPRRAMTSAYAAARSMAVDHPFRAALAGCELRLLLVAWSPYLGYGGRQRQQILSRRLQQLVDGGASDE